MPKPKPAWRPKGAHIPDAPNDEWLRWLADWLRDPEHRVKKGKGVMVQLSLVACDAIADRLEDIAAEAEWTGI